METMWQFIAVAGTAASIAGVILAWQTRDTQKILTRMDIANRVYHEMSQGMLTQMDQRHAQAQRETRELLAQMDRATEQRAETLKALLARRES